MLIPAMHVLVRLLLQPAAGPATAPAVDLVWRAPPGCPDAAAVGDMLAALPHRPEEPDGGRASARADVVRSGDRWQLRLDIRASGARYRRTMRADDCEVLARATALLIAIHLDPLGLAGRLDPPGGAARAPTPAPTSSAPAGVIPAPPAPRVNLPERPGPSAALPAPPGPPPGNDLSPETGVPPKPPPARDLSPETDKPPAGPVAPVADTPGPPGPAAGPPRPLDDMSEQTGELAARGDASRPAALAGHLRFAGGVDAGVLPGVGGLGGLFGGLSFPRVRVEAGLVGAPLRIAGQAASARFDRLTAALRVCPTWRPTRDLALALCLGGEAGAIRGIARAVPDPRPRWVPWVGLTLGPALRWTVAGPLGLYFDVEAVLALGRPQFTANPDNEPIYRAGRAGARAMFGFDLQFAQRNR